MTSYILLSTAGIYLLPLQLIHYIHYYLISKIELTTNSETLQEKFSL